MGNINLYKSSSASGPWSLVKSNISSPVTITENTGGSLYYAVRDEGNGGNIKPSDYKIISKPVYVFKSTDKVNNITFDDTTDINALIVKINSTCDLSTARVYVEYNPKNTGWKTLGVTTVGSNKTLKYTKAATDKIGEGDTIQVRAYIADSTQSLVNNFRTNYTQNYTYTLQFTDAAPTINGSLPIDSSGYGNTSLSNTFTLYSSDGVKNYGTGVAARIPLSFDDIYNLCNSSSNISVDYNYKCLKIGVYSTFRSSNFIVTNIFYNKSLISNNTLIEFPCKIATKTVSAEHYLSDSQQTSLVGKKDSDYTNLKICGAELNCIKFGEYNSSYVCETPTFLTKNLPSSDSNKNNRVLGLLTSSYIGIFGACGYAPEIDTGDVNGIFANVTVGFLKPLNTKSNKSMLITTVESSGDGSTDYGFLFLA